MTFDEALILNSISKDKLKIIAVLDISYGGDVIMSKRSIKSISELKGKKVGVESTALGIYMIHRAIQNTPNINIEDIDIEYFVYSEHYKALKNNLVDAVVTFEPVKTKLLNLGANIIFDSTQIQNEIFDVMVVKEKTIKTHKKELNSFVKGWFKSLKYIENNYDKATKRMAKYENITSTEFKVALKGIKIPSLKDNKQLLNKNNPTILKSMENIENFLLNNKQIKEKNIDLKEIFTDRFL